MDTHNYSPLVMKGFSMIIYNCKQIRFIRVPRKQAGRVNKEELVRRGYQRYLDVVAEEKDQALEALNEIMKALASDKIK